MGPGVLKSPCPVTNEVVQYFEPNVLLIWANSNPNCSASLWYMMFWTTLQSIYDMIGCFNHSLQCFCVIMTPLLLLWLIIVFVQTYEICERTSQEASIWQPSIWRRYLTSSLWSVIPHAVQICGRHTYTLEDSNYLAAYLAVRVHVNPCSVCQRRGQMATSDAVYPKSCLWDQNDLNLYIWKARLCSGESYNNITDRKKKENDKGRRGHRTYLHCLISTYLRNRYLYLCCLTCEVSE